jgi:hypothetical protein
MCDAQYPILVVVVVVVVVMIASSGYPSGNETPRLTTAYHANVRESEH